MAKEIPNGITDCDDIQDAIIAFTKMASYHYQPAHKRGEELKVAEWLQELAGYKDNNFISADFLIKNGFEKRKHDFLYSDFCVEISAQCTDNEAGIWRVCLTYLEFGHTQILDICTLGQLRMFLTLCGQSELTKQFKS